MFVLGEVDKTQKLGESMSSQVATKAFSKSYLNVYYRSKHLGLFAEAGVILCCSIDVIQVSRQKTYKINPMWGKQSSIQQAAVAAQ